MDTVQEQWDALLFDVRRSVRYHTRRREFYEKWNLSTSALSLLFGSATIFSVIKDFPGFAMAAAVLVTVTSTIDLVVGTSRMARLHFDLSRRFIALEKNMMLRSVPIAQDYSEIWAARLDIEADEPLIKRLVDVMCHNELIRAQGLDESHCKDVPFIKRVTAHLISWNYHPAAKHSKGEQ